MSISSIQIPLTYHNISEELNNNVFRIEVLDSDNNLSLYFLLITIIGGSLISNTSGIKLTRFYILLKTTSSEIIRLISPNSVVNKTIYHSDKKISDDNVKISFLIFISFDLNLENLFIHLLNC